MKALLSAVVLLTLPSIAYALPFVPTFLEATSLESRFVETGTNTTCVNCEDLDSSNDLALTLSGFSADGIDGFGLAGGFVTLTGFLESIRDVNLTIEYDLRVVSYYGGGDTPEELAAYPLPSVVYGTVGGYLLGGNLVNVDDVLEECCAGLIGSALFQTACCPSIWSLADINDYGGGIPFNGEVHWDEMPYTPEVTAVSEPTTLLLLGGGLIATRMKRLRSHGSWPPP
jgi:hypothetical protein